MPMVLRSRRSIHPGQVSEVELRNTTATRSRPTRQQGSVATYEESDESDSETVQSEGMMEVHVGAWAELEEAAAAPAAEKEEAALTARDLKFCSVVLDRFEEEDKLGKKEFEEKEDMNRKGGKPASRIPTFHKRPPGLGTELTVSKREAQVHVAQPLEKASTLSMEVAKSKTSEGRETALHQPEIRAAKFGFEVSSVLSSSEEEAPAAYSSLVSAPRSWGMSEFVRSPLMTASPRPALRPHAQSAGDESESTASEADLRPDEPWSRLPHEGSLSQKLWEDVVERSEAALKDDAVSSSGDTVKRSEAALEDSGDTQSAEAFHTVAQVEAIMDEEPPWEKKSEEIAHQKDSRSSSDAEHEGDLAGEESEGQDSEEGTEQDQEPLISQTKVSQLGGEKADTDGSPSSVEPPKPSKARSAKSDKKSQSSSFALFFLLPTTLLLLGGVGLHIWQYGVPMSVAQLIAQLELHWLEGIGLVPEPCSTDCRVHLVESIPAGLSEASPPSTRSIADSWLHLLHRANSSVQVAAFYFTLRSSDLKLEESSDSEGRKVFEQLKELDSKGVKLQIAVNSPQQSTQDTLELAAAGAEVREVDLQAITGGIIHTKLWVVDQEHLYLGSANMDWRSLSEVKEVGLSVEDCSCLAQDASRIFGVYWSLGAMTNSSLPPYWPARFSALSSSQNPMILKFNGVPAQVYLSSAPPQISARGRSDDLATILSIIADAQKSVYISVMDFLPTSQYTEPLRLWPPIDSALRAAACTRGVQVRLMVSCWKHSPASMFTFLQSLLVLSRPPLHCDIDVKIFTVPSTAEQKKIPFARVNHAKYMVTDRVVYIGTSNWSENYFTQTAGVGLVVNQTGSEVGPGQQTLQSQAEELFLRDWSSSYTSSLSVDDVDICPSSSL